MIIKLTKQTWKTINPTKTGPDNQRLDSSETILFNTDKVIEVRPSSVRGGSYISYTAAMVGSMYVKESVEEIYELINKVDQDEDKLHELARLFMGMFSFPSSSLDEWLYEHGEELTDDDRNLGHYILKQFN